MIDAGSELGLAEIGSIRATQDSSELGELQPDLMALTAVNPASEHIAITRADGITSALTRPGGSLVAGQSALIQLSGWTPEEMKLRSPVALHVTFPETASGALAGSVPLDEAQRLRTRNTERLAKLRDLIERARRYASVPAAEGMFKDPRMEAVVPYASRTRPVVFHADSARGIEGALRFADEMGLKAILEGARDAWRVAPLLAQKQVPVIYGPVYSAPGEYDPYDARYAAPGVLHRAGVKLCFQSASAALAKDLPHQAGIASAYGLPKDAALRAMTLGAAEILGVDAEIGSIERGKLANLIVTDGDPLEIASHVHYLFIGGRPVPLENKQTRLYRHYLQRLEPAARQ
jgi:imidazolonepropionase-like amidohydrolase